MSYKPPFEITSVILSLIQGIFKEIGFLSRTKLQLPSVFLRKSNRIKTIQSSLSIEGNSLTIDQITAVLEGKRVVAPIKDIKEAENAIQVYSSLNQFDSLKIADLLKAHKMMMNTLVTEKGQWRSGGVGVIQGNKVAHMAPQAKMVPKLMSDLFQFIVGNRSISWVIKACVFHYELEFIHPFADGNGRIGRLWQQLLLMKEESVFEYVPIETLIKNNQQQYYQVLGKCDQEGASTLFIEFMLEQILFALQTYNANFSSEVSDADSRLMFAMKHFSNDWFSRKEYLLFQKTISTATASRDLKYAREKKKIILSGKQNQTKYKFHQT